LKPEEGKLKAAIKQCVLSHISSPHTLQMGACTLISYFPRAESKVKVYVTGKKTFPFQEVAYVISNTLNWATSLSHTQAWQSQSFKIKKGIDQTIEKLN